MQGGEKVLGFDLDLAVMDDEALVVLAEECEYGPARDELIVRYDGQIDRLIGWLARSYHLSHADVEDARQNAIFWIVEAIAKYDTEQIGKVRGCNFRSFVYRVLMSRFKDYTKHLRRVESRYDRSAQTTVDEASRAGQDDGAEDPADIVEEKESMYRLREALTSLDDESGRLWQLLAGGTSLRKIASELNVSYDSVKRRRRKLVAWLKGRLSSKTGNPA